MILLTIGVGTKPARYLPARDSMNGSQRSLRATLRADVSSRRAVGAQALASGSLSATALSGESAGVQRVGDALARASAT